MHCLVDIGNCNQSPYELLVENPDGSSPLYCRAYTLDDAGRALAIAEARATGDKGAGCTTCDGGGSLKKGFRATVWGTLGDADKDGGPPTLKVTKLATPGTTVGVDKCDGPETVPEAPVCEQNQQVPWYIGHGLCMLLGWGLMLPSGVLAARFLKHKPDALWFKIHKPVMILQRLFPE